VKKHFLILLILLFSQWSWSQDSFKELLSKGHGEVTVNFRTAPSFIYLNEHGGVAGVEFEILEDFYHWVELNHNVEIIRNYNVIESFSELYLSISESKSEGLFGVCSFSITSERLKEVKFSPAYLPDLEIMVSSADLPILKDSAEFSKEFGNAKAITVKGSTFEEDIKNLKPLVKLLDMEYVSNTEDVISAVENQNNCYGFIELPNYFSLYQKGIKLNRQNLFLVQREGYGIIYPKNSDWNEPLWEYFQQESNQKKIIEILQKHFGSELVNFITEIQESTDMQKNVLLLTKENELESLVADNLKLSLENEKLDNEKAKAERKVLESKEETLEWFIILGVISFIIVLIIVFYAYYLKNKDHKIISAQKKEVEAQKDIVIEKHRLITSSIHYAKTIQNAMLQGEEYTNKALPEHFVFFQPKDVVSGDFYWSKIIGDYGYFASVDCTGHGVPGGFMSVLGISLINDIVYDHDLLKPSEILDKLNKRVIDELDQSDKEGSSKDGMDISLSRINLKTLELVWAGAHNPLYVYRNGELIELKPNKQPIGYFEYGKPFDDQTLQLEKNDMIYSSTDGYPDQFGGVKGKKLKSSGFKNLLSRIQVLSTKEQKKYLERHFSEWKGENEQVDDACVIGMRI
jgi:serine phosphatase RsbU (regulator of sigma subunit)